MGKILWDTRYTYQNKKSIIDIGFVFDESVVGFSIYALGSLSGVGIRCVNIYGLVFVLFSLLDWATNLHFSSIQGSRTNIQMCRWQVQKMEINLGLQAQTLSACERTYIPQKFNQKKFGSRKYMWPGKMLLWIPWTCI